MHRSMKDARHLITRISVCVLGVLFVLAFYTSRAEAQRKILVYTRNWTPDGKGYVHDNIASSVAAIQKMGVEGGFGVDVTDDPTVFTDAKLNGYAALVFSNSNNQAFATEEQKEGFKKYIQGGGGFVGIHSASGSQRDWPYFWSVLGGKFVVHPKQQAFTIRNVDSSKVAGKDLPAEFQWTDEFYLLEHYNPGMHPILVADRSKLDGLDATGNNPRVKELGGVDKAFPNPVPLAWWQKFDGGREVYIAIGHNKEEYAKPMLYNLIRNGITWAMTK